MRPSFVSFPLFLYFFDFCEDRQEKEKSGEIAFALLMFHRDLSTTQRGDFCGAYRFFTSHIHLEPWANHKQNYTKTRSCFLGPLRESGLSHDIFLKFSLRTLEVIEVKE